MILSVICKLTPAAMFILDDHDGFARGIGEEVANVMAEVLESASKEMDPDVLAKKAVKGVVPFANRVNPDLIVDGFFEDSETFVLTIDYRKFIHAPSRRLH